MTGIPRAACAALAALVAGCAGGAVGSPALFEDCTAASGIDFVHVHGGTGAHELAETMGGGVALLDLEGDGDLDVYAAQSGPVRRPDGRESRKGARNALYRNDGTGRFEAVQGAAGAGDPGYGQGVSAGDFDGDGLDDLLSLNWGPNRLYRNRGGELEDATAAAGLGAEDEWSVSAAFFDADGDGDLDLYVVNYLVAPPAVHERMGMPDGFGGYPHPDMFPGVPDRLYENVGGRFVERTREAGVLRESGKGLGVVPTDVELDGRIDLYVANDSVPNFLFRNLGGFRFEEIGLSAGVAYSGDGASEAGMGVDTADVDGDGDFDLFVTNLDAETNTLYANAGGARPRFADATDRAGLAEPSLNLVGFGALFLDADRDGDPDLVVANGHVLDNAHVMSDVRTYEQPNQLYLNDGAGRFAVAPPEVAGAGLGRLGVSRGTACGDLDGDGDLDLVVAGNDEPLQVLCGTPPDRPWLLLSLAGPPGNPRGLGAAVVLELAGGGRRLARVESARSYASASQPAVALGLPEPVTAVEVLWPGGARERFADAAGFSGARVLRHGDGERP